MRAVDFVDSSTLRVGGVEFYFAFPLPDDLPSTVLPLLKPKSLIDRYVDLVTRQRPSVIVELGIHRGGSTAFLSEVAEPECLVAIELGDPAEPLKDYIEARGLHDTVMPFYGVDQGDRSAVTQIVERRVGDRPIDLVVDDASHLYRPTVASFEVLYPRLRPGGMYVIEDWAGDHHIASRMAKAVEGATADRTTEIDRIADAAVPQITDEARASGLVDAFRKDPEALVGDLCRAVIEGQNRVPLSRLGLELVLAQAEMPGLYESITITDGWLVIERGDADLDPRTFRVGSTWHDYYRLLDGLDYAGLE